MFLGPLSGKAIPARPRRVLLPMGLAFNVLLPRGYNWRWWAVLFLGNLTLLFSSDLLKPPGREDFKVRGPHELIMVEASGQTTEARV